MNRNFLVARQSRLASLWVSTKSSVAATALAAVMFLGLAPVSTIVAAEFPVALGAQNGSVSTDRLTQQLIDLIRSEITLLNNDSSPNFGRSHHIKINIDTHPIILDSQGHGVAVSLNTVLMLKNDYSSQFVPMLIDTEVGFCTENSLKLCTKLAMAKVAGALKYAGRADVLIENIESGLWDRSKR